MAEAQAQAQAQSKAEACTNPQVAARHERSLHEFIETFDETIKEEAIVDVKTGYRTLVKDVKNLVTCVLPKMEDADVKAVLNSVVDVGCDWLVRGIEAATGPLDRTEVEEEIEEPSTSKKSLLEGKPVNAKVARKVGQVFESLAQAHTQASVAATYLSELSLELPPAVYFDLVKATSKSHITLKIPELYLPAPYNRDEDTQKRSQDKYTQVHQNMIEKHFPNPDYPEIRREPADSPTRLLAAVIYYKLGMRYANRPTQAKVAQLFNVNMTHFKRALTGKKYKGGEPADKQAKKAAKDTGESSTLPDLEPPTPRSRPGRAARTIGEKRRRQEGDDDDEEEEAPPVEPTEPPERVPKSKSGKGVKKSRQK